MTKKGKPVFRKNRRDKNDFMLPQVRGKKKKDTLMGKKVGPDRGQQAGRPGINCFSCSHFYITYEKGFPYGCRAMGFKSRLIPSREVYESSGKECQFFSKKERP